MSMREPFSERSALSDLDVLQRRDTNLAAPARPLLPRLLLGGLVLGGLAAVYGAFLHPLIFPPHEVRLAPVRQVKGGMGSGATRRALASAAGWLEADPYPVSVRPLVPGVVERYEALEGQRVKAGETVVAVLRNPELENALITAEAVVAVKTAQAGLAEERVRSAQALLEQKLDLRNALLQAEVVARRDRESLAEAQAALGMAEANLRKVEIELAAQRQLQGSGSTPPISVSLAEASAEVAKAERDMRRAALGRAKVEVDVHERALLLAQEALDQPKALGSAVSVAGRELAAAQAEHAQAAAERDVAASNVRLLTVRAPADGVVLRLLSAPGAPAGPMGDMRESGTVGPGSTGLLDTATGALALLYDPERMQARVEVPLADLGGIGEGTEVALEVESVPGKVFAGRVTRLLGEANIQNNKLWVKVRLTVSDPLLKPEMLCRAKFLAPAAQAGEAPAGRPRLEVPSGAVRGDVVFVFDPTGGGRARRVSVVKKGEADGFTEVEGALGVSNEVILDPTGLEDGMRVKGAK